MTIDYFYTPPDRIEADTLSIDGNEFNHLVHVMRKKEGDTIRVVDGAGRAFDVTLTRLKKKNAEGTILLCYQRHHEPSLDVTLAVGILKNPSRFDFLVEKSTEIGVRSIVPLITERTIPLRAKTERWQKLALAAMKQSCRSWMPEVRELQSLESVLKSSGSIPVKIVAHPGDERGGLQHPESVRTSALVLIGPEGGFSETELQQCREHGCEVWSLGTRRLRTETAAIVALAKILTEK